MVEIIIQTEKKQIQIFTEELGNGVELELVKIPDGSFTMGAPSSEEGSGDSERPQHEVTITSFLMGRYPITQAQWREIAQRTDLKKDRDLNPDPSRFKEPYQGIDRWNRPVEGVSWYDAVEFCHRLSKLTGRNYRLPSEAEWEYACRAGTTTPFHCGETITTDLANYRGTDDKIGDKVYPGNYGKGPKGEYRQETTPVGYFKKVANQFGLYDMHGNVWEWCEDNWHDNYEGAPMDGSAWITKKSNTVVVRGGSWGIGPNYCRSAFRLNYVRRSDSFNLVGFRVVWGLGRDS